MSSFLDYTHQRARAEAAVAVFRTGLIAGVAFLVTGAFLPGLLAAAVVVGSALFLLLGVGCPACGLRPFWWAARRRPVWWAPQRVRALGRCPRCGHGDPAAPLPPPIPTLSALPPRPFGFGRPRGGAQPHFTPFTAEPPPELPVTVDPLRPWNRAPIAGPKPELPAYGFYDGRTLRGATRDELAAVMREGPVPPLVWTPESERMVPPEQVPYLLVELRARQAAQERGWVRFLALVFAGLVLSVVTSGEPVSLQSPLVFYAGICTLWLAMAVRDWRAARRMGPADVHARLLRARHMAWVRARSVPHSRLLGRLLVAVGLVQLAFFVPSVEAAGLVKEAARAGEIWRVLTAAFLHGDILHFGTNYLALLVLGRIVEAHAPRGWLPLVFTVSAICGGVLSIVFLPEATSVGASGGLLGMIGFLAVMAWRRQEELPPGFLRLILTDVGLIAAAGVIGFAVVDNAGHLGGLLAGAALGLAGVPSVRRAPQWHAGPALRRAGNASIALCAAAAAAAVLLTLLRAFHIA
jgi:membrane associated rhomboid family serine protease